MLGYNNYMGDFTLRVGTRGLVGVIIVISGQLRHSYLNVVGGGGYVEWYMPP